ncbi:MAG: dihydrolipoyl dehydrogenase [Pseudomonadota bacterium]
MSDKCKVVVIGGGIGGYPAAIKAARLGAEVTLVEKADLGGTCLNWGCIPTKSLLHAAERFRLVEDAPRFGINSAKPSLDLGAVMSRKDQVVQGLRKGVAGLLKAKKIEVIQGEAELLDPATVRVGGKRLSVDAVILATGSLPAVPPIPGLADLDIWDSNDFLAMSELPSSAIIIGGGVIGVEFAQVLSGLGARVTLLEMMPQLVPGLDREASRALGKALEGQGVKIVTGAKIGKADKKAKEFTVDYQVGGQQEQAKAQRLIVATGRRPASEALRPEKLGLALEGAAVKVDQYMATSLPNVYAAGDLTGGMMLAHLAMAEAECAAVNAMGGKQAMDYTAIPACIYTTPQVATVGLSEEQAREKQEIKVGVFPFAAAGKAAVLAQPEGFVKIVAGAKYGEVLGVHIVGPQATDLIAEGVLAMNLEATVEEIAKTVHPHPTLSEAFMEAAMKLSGGAVHIP